ncbi:hypothetical protein [Sandaracinus amylolyticus]|uniref:DUF7793 family protein n=1 Tax=Sandaracinus amylolyticus TaxID=927083 RepID=UPI001F159AD6|nr:hypothetical protein [Sandaracinus amylolyticus]UJR81647.1 Hypothetical protein I5071_37070 [Sandaracinus amylolyticus]
MPDPDDLVRSLVQSHGLTHAGESRNTAYYRLDDDVLVAIPHEGSQDDGATARDNVARQREIFRATGKRGAIVIFFDRMTSQNKDARAVYQSMDDVLTCTALVGGTMLTRAMASFFLGLSRPSVPIKLFATFDAALAWCRQTNQSADRTLRAERTA